MPDIPQNQTTKTNTLEWIRRILMDIMCLALVVIALINAAHDRYDRATFNLVTAIAVQVFERRWDEITSSITRGKE